jgi:hypothetical protein
MIPVESSGEGKKGKVLNFNPQAKACGNSAVLRLF